MVKLALKINTFLIGITLLSLTIINFFTPNDTINAIANIIFLIFICLFIACSSKISALQMIASIGLLIYYLRDYAHNWDIVTFEHNAQGLSVCLAAAVFVPAFILQVLGIFGAYGKEKLKAILYVFLLLVAAVVMFVSWFARTYEQLGILAYVIEIVAPIFFTFITGLSYKFFVINLVEKN